MSELMRARQTAADIRQTGIVAIIRRLVEAAQTRDTFVIPGVMTPTEAQNAFEAGCRMQKLFPADPIGGPDYLKAVRALPDIARRAAACYRIWHGEG